MNASVLALQYVILLLALGGTLGFVVAIARHWQAGLALILLTVGLIGWTTAPVLVVTGRKRCWVCPKCGTTEEASSRR